MPVNKIELVHKDISYQIVGILFDVYNELGSGHKEKFYEEAVAKELKNRKIPYDRQLYIPLNYKNDKIGSYYLDFLVDKKVVLELKKGNRFTRNNINQVYTYLKANNLKLGIIAQFASKELRFKRIVNIKD